MAFPEILAPAGSFDALTAAVRCGADAVYIGGKNYSARQGADNFDIDEIKRAADFCHLHDVKLHLAVNTIMLDEELNNFEEYIKSAANAGIDACIVQDVGVANIIRSVIPDMPLHASTQMTVHTLEGALWAKEQGFCRVVVSRELSREEIKCIIIGSGMEVEQFVHGALCMSVSGQCYLSALIGSRSANRGRCAQACRLPFSACGKDDVCSLSLKDLSLVEHMNELIEDGVTSLKIEGRMKRPEYVAAAVTALKMAIAGEEPDMETLKAVFSRSGFTDGYYTGKRHNMFGTREKEDVISASVVIPKLQELYRKESHPIGLSITAKLCADEPFTLIGKSDDGICVAVYGDVPLPAFKKPSDYESLKKQLSKLGDTVYYLSELKAECDGVSMLPVSAVNALRRKLIEELDLMRIESSTTKYKIAQDNYAASLLGDKLKYYARHRNRDRKPKLRFRVATGQQFNAIDLNKDDECIISLELAEKIDAKENYILQSPRFVPDESKLISKLEKFFEKGFRRLLCENPSHMRIGKRIGFRLSIGTDMHTSNSLAAKVYEDYGAEDIILSPELKASQACSIRSELPVGVYAYGYCPVMLMRCCPIKNEVGCKNCTGHLIDRTSRKFSVVCNKDYIELLNSVPVWVADKLSMLYDCDFILLDLANENDIENIKNVVDSYRYGAVDNPKEFTRGLLQRGIESINEKDRES